MQLYGETKNKAEIHKAPTVCKVGNFHIRAAFVSSAESNFIFTSIQDEDWLNNLFSDCNIIDLSSNDTL